MTLAAVAPVDDSGIAVILRTCGAVPGGVVGYIASAS